MRFLLRRPRVLAALAGWSALEALHAFVSGYSLARALDDGFLAGRPAVGLAWLAVTAVAVLAGALGTGRVFGAVADLTEPLRDALVRGVVTRALKAGTPRAGGGGGVAAGGNDGDSAVVSRLTHQVEIARDSFAGLVMVSRSFLFSAVGVLTGLLSLAPLLLVVVLPPLVLGVGIFAASLRPLARRQQVLLESDENLARELGATFRGLRDVAACGFEDRAQSAGDARIDAEVRAADSLARWGVTRAVALGVGGRLPLVVLLVAAPWLLSRGVTAGALAGALTYQTQVLMPALQSLVHGLGTAGARLAVVIGRLREPPSAQRPGAEPGTGAEQDPRVPALPDRALRGRPAVDVRGVSFRYGAGAAPLIDRLSLVVPEGGHLAVVGPSGTGKSTLAALIAGMLEPDTGRIALAGRPVSGGRAAGERVLIPQEAYVFSGSLRDNLVYLCPLQPSDDEVERAVAALGGEALAARLGGLDGDVEPAGLSAGERQSIALIRAYLSPAPLAVLDEATCHLDAAAEARAERAFAGRTVRRAGGARAAGALVVVAHRISSARRAPRVLVLDGSRAETGTHSELLERSPLYRELASVGGSSPRRSQPSRTL
ncbi:ABC transporter ATP-binding protein [Streptomyces sp. WMMB 322]|uniref:ATP-binding cassette domain-containing protein n=1 Tax=Streptomyces sp. WMMB 322 TaxID=1286821 RepID=UPI0006E3C0AA